MITLEERGLREPPSIPVESSHHSCRHGDRDVVSDWSDACVDDIVISRM